MTKIMAENKKLKAKKGDNGWGYVDANGNWVIEPQFDDAWNFQEGFGRVEVNQKQGFIRPDGSYFREPVFEFAYDFSDGLSYFEIKDENGKEKSGILKSDGTYFAEPIYDWIGYYLDEQGNSCNGMEFKNGLIYVTLGKNSNKKKMGCLREDGTFLLTPDRYTYIGPFVNGYSKIWAIHNKKYGIFSIEGDVIAEPAYDEVDLSEEGFFPVKLDDKRGLLDAKGSVIFEPVYDRVCVLGEGVAKAVKDDESILANSDGILLTAHFDEVNNFSEGVARVKVADKYGYIKTDGSYLAEPIFDEAKKFNDGQAAIVQGRKRGVLKLDGSIEWEKAIFCKMGENEKWGFVDEDGNWVVEPQYEGTWDSREGFAVIMDENYLCGYVDTEGKVIVEPKYDRATDFYYGNALVSDEDGEGVILDTKGNEVADVPNVGISEPEPECKLDACVAVWSREGNADDISLEDKDWVQQLIDWFDDDDWDDDDDDWDEDDEDDEE